MNPKARLVGGSFQAFCLLCLFTLSPPKTDVSVWFIDGVLAAESVIMVGMLVKGQAAMLLMLLLFPSLCLAGECPVFELAYRMSGCLQPKCLLRT